MAALSPFGDVSEYDVVGTRKVHSARYEMAGDGDTITVGDLKEGIAFAQVAFDAPGTDVAADVVQLVSIVGNTVTLNCVGTPRCVRVTAWGLNSQRR